MTLWAFFHGKLKLLTLISHEGAPEDVEAGVAAGGGSDVIDGTVPGSGGVAAPVTVEQTTAEASPKGLEDGATEVPVLDDEAESTSEQLLKIKIEEDGKVKKYKKTLRLSTEAVVSGRKAINL